MLVASHWYSPESFIRDLWTSSLPPNTADRPAGSEPLTLVHTTAGAGLPLAEHCIEATSLSFTVRDGGTTMTSGEERDSPGSPLGPGMPGGPASPFSPWAPFSPAGPMMPRLPAGPGGPMMPRCPVLPDLPFCPLRPGRPGGPGGPWMQIAPLAAQGLSSRLKICSNFSSMEFVLFLGGGACRRTRFVSLLVSTWESGFWAGGLLASGALSEETAVNQKHVTRLAWFPHYWSTPLHRSDSFALFNAKPCVYQEKQSKNMEGLITISVTGPGRRGWSACCREEFRSGHQQNVLSVVSNNRISNFGGTKRWIWGRSPWIFFWCIMAGNKGEISQVCCSSFHLYRSKRY